MNQNLHSEYLPSISWWREWISNGMPSLNDDLPYRKRSWANRCTIDSPNGPLTLTIPVRKPSEGHYRQNEILLSDHDNWRSKHWHALQSSYFNSPFFEYYQDDIKAVYDGNQESLTEFNLQLINVVAGLIQLNSETIGMARRNIEAKGRQNDLEQNGYYQVFAHKHGFIPNLSIIDLLMNMGPESILYLAK